MAPIPYQSHPSSMSRSPVAEDNVHPVTEVVLSSSLSRKPLSTSLDVSTLPTYYDAPESQNRDGSIPQSLSAASPHIEVEPDLAIAHEDTLAAIMYSPSFGSSATLATTSLTRERLRLAELERDELRRAVENERAVVDRLKREGSRTMLSSNEAQRRISQLKRDIKIAGAEFPQRSTNGLFKAVCSTDLLFLIDTTSSMLAHIKAAKEQIVSIVNDIGKAFLNEAEIRMAVVGYKDHTDRPNIQFLDFTPSADRVRSFIAGLHAKGGADLPEDVLGGFKQALNASWMHQTRCIIHIGDAPPHGRTLHDMADKADSYIKPGSEPHNLTHQPLFEQMVRLNINYALLRINESTDRMALTIFKQYAASSAGCTLHKSNKYYREACEYSANSRSSYKSRASSKRSGGGGLLFEEQALGTTYSALRHLVLKSVTNSASRTAVRLLSSVGSRTTSKAGTDKKRATNLMAIDEEDNDTEIVQLETTPPQWTTPHWLNENLMVEGFSPDVVVHSARTLNDMMTHDDHIKMNIVELTIHKRSRPFSEGAMRVVSYARTAASTDYFVVKSFKKDGKKFAHLAEDMRCQALCKAFALEFNAMSGEERPIDFIVTTCLKGRSRGATDEECMSLEPYIEGTYIKYNNNCGYVNEANTSDPFNQAAQAFSHFTFERSRGRFLVSDMQGVGGVLTDPAIHTLDPERFKLTDTNLNKEGFKFFFATHVCNDICLKLQLKSNVAMVMSGSYNFRESWPEMDNTVCCSNKLCGKIVRLVSAWKSDEFPGYHWCHTCWQQLQSSRVKLLCVAPEEPYHEFEVSPFFYESQGRSTPRTCPEHYEEEVPEPRTPSPGLEPPRTESPRTDVSRTRSEVSRHRREVSKTMAPRAETSKPVVVSSSIWARLKFARKKRSRRVDL